jgi:hypothetical protein
MKQQIITELQGGTDSPTIQLYRSGYGQISNVFNLDVNDLGNSLFRKLFCQEFKRRFGLDASITQDSHLNVRVYLLICSVDALFIPTRWEANLEKLAHTVYASATGAALRSNR